jgi:methylthioribose-1-phosphate isomerase
MGLAAAADAEAAKGALSPRWIEDAAGRLAAARPTAVDLGWALARMRQVAQNSSAERAAPETLARALREEAQRIWDDEKAMSRAIGEAGAGLIPPGATVLTHCNTGALATGGLGTALAAVYVAHERGQGVHVIATETRPLRQGARLTAWELGKAGIPTKVIVDGAAGTLMREGAVDLVITGADRITAGGDAANKIGTYGLAVLAKVHGIPFYMAAPRSTFDLALTSGDDIPIEHRAAEEVDPAPGVAVLNPAFDVTPAELVTAFITDRGVIEPPYEEGIKRTMG